MQKNKKKVLLVVRKPVGGIRTFIRYVYLKFDPELWDFSVLAPDIPEMRLLVSELSCVHIRYVPIGGDNYPSPLSLTFHVAKELIFGRYDLVHSHGFSSGICAVLGAKLSRTPHLMTSHDIINENQFNGAKGRVEKQFMGQLLGLIETIHSVSHDAEKNLLTHFPNLKCREGKSIVISNGIEIERFSDATPRDLRGELGLDMNTFLIGFFGRFMSQKGFRYLIDAIDLLSKDDSLTKKPIVLAFGDGGFIREEKQSIREKGLGKYFNFMPFEANIAGAIKGLDVIAMPSLWEACPLLPMEVLCCGTPLIASDCIGLREVVQDTPTIVIETANHSALAISLRNEIKNSRTKDFVGFIDSACIKFDVLKTKLELNDLYVEITNTINSERCKNDK